MFEGYSFYHLLPDENLDVCVENENEFFETMYERMRIWKRRFIDKLEKPWTDNAILRDYKFTNVYRELDRSSQWLINNIIRDKNLSLADLAWKTLVYRTFNNPDTFELSPWRNGIPSLAEYKIDEFYDFIVSVRNRGMNPYTSAYIVRTLDGFKKDHCYAKIVVPNIYDKINDLLNLGETASRPEEIIEFLKTIPLMGGFMSHEFYQDLTYIPIYSDKQFMQFDQNDFTNVGPGAEIGIRLIYPSLEYHLYKDAIKRLRDMAVDRLAQVASREKEDVSYVFWNKDSNTYKITNQCNITLHQIEMWLCEYQKYWKMKNSIGKQRSRFIPKTQVL